MFSVRKPTFDGPASGTCPATEAEISSVCDRLREVITAEAGPKESLYWGHEPRYRRMLASVTRLVPRGATVLDVGSHFLHQAALLSLLGYRVIGMDVGAFAGSESIERRARMFDVENLVVDHFERGEFLGDRTDAVDLVLFCEILEHITFNPVRFWKQIYNLLRIGGKVYITTPNGMRLWAVGAQLKSGILSRGLGIPVTSILGLETYGHHWKEYSPVEIRQLFRMLSPDFNVEVTMHRREPFEPWTGIKPLLRNLARGISVAVPPLRDQIEAVITLTGRTSWTGTSPLFF